VLGINFIIMPIARAKHYASGGRFIIDAIDDVIAAGVIVPNFFNFICYLHSVTFWYAVDQALVEDVSWTKTIVRKKRSRPIDQYIRQAVIAESWHDFIVIRCSHLILVARACLVQN